MTKMSNAADFAGSEAYGNGGQICARPLIFDAEQHPIDDVFK